MSVHSGELSLSTRGDNDVIDITAEVERVVGEGPVRDGLVTAFVRGSTAAVTTMEYESGGVADLQALLDRLIPAEGTTSTTGSTATPTPTPTSGPH
jgi:thiamine phosphate synthase YjbQ (UPF0047 family)